MLLHVYIKVAMRKIWFTSIWLICLCCTGDLKSLSLQAQDFVKLEINYPCFLSLFPFPVSRFPFPFSLLSPFLPLFPSTYFLYWSGFYSVCHQEHSKYYTGVPGEHFKLYLYISLICFSTLSQVQSVSYMPSFILGGHTSVFCM